MKKQIGTIFWDLDGTLICSEHIHEQAGFAAFAELGLAVRHDQVLTGMENLTCFEKLTGLQVNNSQTQELYRKWDLRVVELAMQGITQDQAIRQSINLFQYFDSIGMIQSVVSNSNRKLIEHSLKQIGVFEMVQDIFSRDSVEFGKPNPQMYLNAIAAQANHADKCLAFEDSATGITAARAANLDVIGIGLNTKPHATIALDLQNTDWLESLNLHYEFTTNYAE